MSRLSRVVRQFVDVKKREVEPALLFFLFWFLIIVVFWLLKPLKTGLFVEHLGARTELYAKLANIGVAMAAVAVFSWLYDRLGSRRLILVLVGGFVGALLAFAAALGQAGAPSEVVNWSFYLFGDAWTTIWVTTFWAYLNEMTGTEQSKRLYGLIGGGGVVGGLVGTGIVAGLVERVGTPPLLVAAAMVTALLALLAWRIESLASSPDAPIARGQKAEIDVRGEDEEEAENAALEGAKIALASKFIFSIVMIVFLYEFASQILDYQYKTALEGVQGQAATQGFYATVGVIQNTISVITQFFLVAFVIRKFGITVALLVTPVAMLLASGAYFAVPSLWAASTLTISDNAFNYSINQTARETLFVPTDDDVKYKARAFANMFVQRFGKGGAILVALALTLLPVRYLTLIAAAVILAWAGFAKYAGQHFEEETGGGAGWAIGT